MLCVGVSDAYEMAKMLCEQYYPTAPALKVKEFNGTRFINQICFMINEQYLSDVTCKIGAKMIFG